MDGYQKTPYTVSIIQLEEVPPPTPLPPLSGPSSSSWSSSRSDDFSATDSDESESACESYCSSADELPPDHPESQCAAEDAPQRAVFADCDDSYDMRMKRIFAWREHYAKATGTALPARARSHSPLKRKFSDEDCDDAVSCASSFSKRPRPYSRPDARTIHSCPACDACFPTQQSLCLHGQDNQASEACRVAVEYDLES